MNVCLKKILNKFRRFELWMLQCPVRCLILTVLVIAVLWTAQCSVFQNVLGLDILETISWGAQWQFGHLKHPPLSGWLGYIFSILSGHSDWSMYFAAQVCVAIAAIYVYKLACCFFDKRRAVLAVLLIYFLPNYYNPSSMKFCSHFVEAALQPVVAYLFFVALRENLLRHWVLCGLFIGLAFLGKYSIIMLCISLAVIAYFEKAFWKQLCNWKFYIGVLAALVIVSPHLIWLYNHDFCCITHVNTRISDDIVPWYYKLEIVGVALYPFIVAGGILFASIVPEMLKKRSFYLSLTYSVNKRALLWSVLLCGIPSLIFIIIAFCGKDVVMMWFSSLDAWCGIAAVALAPTLFKRKHFLRVWRFLVVFTFVAWIIDTVDLTTRTRFKIHVKPIDFLCVVENFWSNHATGKIPVVIGERRLAGIVENYATYRPPACVLDDSVNLSLVNLKIRKHGALLLGSYPGAYKNTLNNFYPGLDKKIVFEKRCCFYKSLFGKRKCEKFFMAYLPPEKEWKKLVDGEEHH